MARSLHNLLTDTEGAGCLMTHAKLLLKLSHSYSTLVPAHFLQASRIANYKKQTATVVIHADNGAIAAKLRHMAPGLLDGFAKTGLECSDIRIKVQTRNLPQPDSVPATRKVLPQQARLRFAALMSALPESAPLKKSIADLLARAADEAGE